MQLRRFQDAAAFYRHVEPFLLAHEAEHCVLLGVITTLMRTDTELYPPYLACVEQDGEVVAVALRTPPHNLALSMMDDLSALKPLADDLYAVYGELTATDGSKAVSKAFAEIWQQVSGQAYALRLEEGLYRLDSVNPVSGVSGEYVVPTEADEDLLVQWLIEFSDEAVDGISREDAVQNIHQRLTSEPTLRGVRLWMDDGKPMSMAGFSGPTPHGIRVGPVYTPLQYRGRGYASACVATLSQELLDQGRDFVFLFTDLSNPTSNRIYQNIGYKLVSHVDRYAFEAIRKEEQG